MRNLSSLDLSNSNNSVSRVHLIIGINNDLNQELGH